MRNRIKGHMQVRASELVPHELNPRTHSQAQKDALAAIYREVGYARSLLGYELPDGRIKLIDGHLRLSQAAPDEMLDVEVLDVTDKEARMLLLTIDPLAQLANYSDAQLLQLRDITTADDATLNAMWANLHQHDAATMAAITGEDDQPSTEPVAIKSQWLVIIDCPSDAQQAITLAKCQQNGWSAKAVTS